MIRSISRAIVFPFCPILRLLDPAVGAALESPSMSSAGKWLKVCDELKLIMFGQIALVICSIGFLLLWTAVALVIGPRKYGLSFHPPLWLVRLVYGKQSRHISPEA